MNPFKQGPDFTLAALKDAVNVYRLFRHSCGRMQSFRSARDIFLKRIPF